MSFPKTRPTGHRAGSLLYLRRTARLLFIASAVLVCAGQTGCVFRRMTIHSDPPGALVLLDGEEIGRTPVSVDFDYYGTREITLVKDGYETLTTLERIPPPWYQLVPLDFFSDNLSPWKVTNRQEFMYQLERQEIVKTEDLRQRAETYRAEAQLVP